MSAIMLQGTGSDVGKSVLVAGLARALVRRGYVVRPFKPQNMSNNAAVTTDGGEIGRAQALQARACGVPTSVHMNPVLLKPQSDVGSQVVVQGQVYGAARAAEYQILKPKLMPRVLESFERLRADSDIMLVEGAGSAAEVNLRAGDIANMGFAQAADVPVVLVADIDRGGVIASVVGTHALLPDAERNRVVGYVINKFRGDPRLFDDGVKIINSRTGWPCLGVIPWFHDAGELPDEDAVAMQRSRPSNEAASIRVAVPILSRIANFDDLDPLIAEPDVEVTFVRAGEALPGNADLVVVPGSKSTLSDLKFFREQGWDVDLHAHVRRGGWVVGVCGGYQMLGLSVADPHGIEGDPGEAAGLGLLDVVTVLEGDKTLREVRGEDVASDAAVYGYEIHIGSTTGDGLDRPMLRVDGVPHGATALNGRVQGCYMHGLFGSDEYRSALLSQLAQRDIQGVAYEARVESALDGLAAHLESHLDIDELVRLAAEAGQG
jgi:adenosylcobyric acid synthase